MFHRLRTLSGPFIEPRYVIDVGRNNMAPYLAGRLAFLKQKLDIEGIEASASGTQINGGGGILMRLSPRVNLDLGATYGVIDFDDVEVSFEGETIVVEGSWHGKNLVLRSACGDRDLGWKMEMEGRGGDGERRSLLPRPCYLSRMALALPALLAPRLAPSGHRIRHDRGDAAAPLPGDDRHGPLQADASGSVRRRARRSRFRRGSSLAGPRVGGTARPPVRSDLRHDRTGWRPRSGQPPRLAGRRRGPRRRAPRICRDRRAVPAQPGDVRAVWETIVGLARRRAIPFDAEELVRYGGAMRERQYLDVSHSPAYRRRHDPAYRVIMPSLVRARP